MVKTRATRAGLKYVKELQKKGTKGSLIDYDSLEVQDYLNPSSNMKIENQRYLFSLRSEMNLLHSNFSRNKSIKPTFCVKEYNIELNNEHLNYCPILNKNSDINYSKFLNGTVTEKIEALNQTKDNEEEKKKPT